MILNLTFADHITETAVEASNLCRNICSVSSDVSNDWHDRSQAFNGGEIKPTKQSARTSSASQYIVIRKLIGHARNECCAAKGVEDEAIMSTAWGLSVVTKTSRRQKVKHSQTKAKQKDVESPNGPLVSSVWRSGFSTSTLWRARTAQTTKTLEPTH